LAFIENTYGLPNDIYSGYHFADYWAAQQSSDLSEFFDYTQQRTFTPINLYAKYNLCNNSTCPSSECRGSQCQCDVACFINYQGPVKDLDPQ
jgi:hypothetical protein